MDSNLEAFFNAIRNNRLDIATRNALADYYEENGNDRIARRIKERANDTKTITRNGIKGTIDVPYDEDCFDRKPQAIWFKGLIEAVYCYRVWWECNHSRLLALHPISEVRFYPLQWAEPQWIAEFNWADLTPCVTYRVFQDKARRQTSSTT